jgi:DNA-binding response OmpR family regulator
MWIFHMVIIWIAARTEPSLIEALRAAQWEIKSFAPAEFVQTNPSELGDINVIVFSLLEDGLLELCWDICHKRIAPMLVIVLDLAYAQAALEVGADDFLIEPINPIEALLRVRKLARISTLVRVGELEIDLSAWSINSGGSRIRLSPIEFRRLACLAKRVGQMVNHATILEEVWGWKAEYGARAQVKNYIGRLRKKIEVDLHYPQYVITVPGEGYRLRNQRQWEENRSEVGKSIR